jgi:hypothetical protein
VSFAQWLQTLPVERQRALGERYAADCRARGVFVVKPDGSEVAIPPILSPVAIAPARMAEASADAQRILSALVRLTAQLMEDPTHAALRARLFGSFSPLEAEGLQRTWRSAAALATARVDFLVDERGQPRALEVNATIPAMQGYSDCVAESFLRNVARELGAGEARADALVAENGRNTDDLLDSLLAHHERLGGRTRAPLTIAIVARAGDAQRGELEHYVRRFGERGHRALIVTPAELHVDGGRARAGSAAPDLIYRHIFARRLDAQSTFARMLMEPDRFHIFNPIASHLEVKGMLGLLSAGAIALPDDERAAVARSVPWTRVLAPGAGRGPDGAPLADLPSWVRAHARELVLKRSWDYGGRSVFLGAELDEPAAQARLAALFGDGAPRDWAGLVDRALTDADAWVVQELVIAPRTPQLRIEPDGPRARSLYIDLSAYTNLGVAPSPTGGAVRASESRIVNILGGGGLAPLLRAPVLAQLLSGAPS